MAQENLNIKVGLDTKPAKTDFQSLQKDMKARAEKIAKSFKGPNENITKLQKSLKGVGERARAASSKISQGFKKSKEVLGKLATTAKERLKSSFAAAGKAALTISAALLLAKKALEDLTNTQVAFARAKIFGATTKLVDGFNRQLGGALSKMEALKAVSDFKAAGFSNEEVKKAGELVRAMEVLGGVSKETALEVLKTGEANEDLLNSFGLSSQFIEFQMKKLEESTGRIPTRLDKAKMIMRLFAKEAAKSKNIIQKIDTTSSIDRLFSKLKDLKDKVLKTLAEDLDKNSKGFDELAKSIGTVTKVSISGVKGLSKLINKAAGLFAWFKKQGKKISMGAFGQDPFGQFPSFLEKVEQQSKQVIAIKTKEKKALEKIARDQQQKNKKKPKTAGKGMSEALDDLIGKQSELRNQLRNFTQLFLNNVSTMGGSLAGIISASKDIPEQFRILSSLDFGAKAILKTIGKTRQQIIEMEKVGKLNNKQAKVALLANQIAKAGLNDLKEKVMNAEVMTSELKAQVSGSERLTQLAALHKQIKDKDVDVDKGRVVLLSSIQAITRRIVELEKERVKVGEKSKKGRRASVQIAVLKDLQKRYKDSNKTLTAQSEIQKKILKERLRQVQVLNNEIKPLQEKYNRQKTFRSLDQELIGLQQARNALSLKQDSFQVKINAEKQKEVEIQNRINDLNILAKKQELLTQGAIVSGDQKAIDLSRQKEASLWNQINALQAIKGEQRLLTQEIVKQDSLAGRFKSGFIGAFKSIKDSWRDAMKSFGQSINDALTGSLGLFKHFGAAITEALTGIGNGDWLKNMGAGFLDLLAGISAKFGAVFASIGAGYLAMGNPLGAAVLAASAGLFALAGGLSAASSIVSDTGTGSSTGSSAVSSPSAPPPSVAAPIDRDRERREVFVIINGTPWDNAQDQARSYARWHKKNRRIIGEVMP